MYEGILDQEIESEINSQEDKIVLLVAAMHNRVHHLDLFFPKEKRENLLLTLGEEKEYKLFKEKQLDLETKRMLLKQKNSFEVPQFDPDHLKSPKPRQSGNETRNQIERKTIPKDHTNTVQRQANQINHLESKLNEQQDQIDYLKRALAEVLRKE